MMEAQLTEKEKVTKPPPHISTLNFAPTFVQNKDRLGRTGGINEKLKLFLLFQISKEMKLIVNKGGETPPNNPHEYRDFAPARCKITCAGEQIKLNIHIFVGLFL